MWGGGGGGRETGSRPERDRAFEERMQKGKRNGDVKGECGGGGGGGGGGQIGRNR